VPIHVRTVKLGRNGPARDRIPPPFPPVAGRFRIIQVL